MISLLQPSIDNSNSYYCMAGNFHGVLIFIIIVVDLAVINFSTHENINAYGDTMVMQVHYDGRGHKHCGSAANTPSVNKQQ